MVETEAITDGTRPSAWDDVDELWTNKERKKKEKKGPIITGYR